MTAYASKYSGFPNDSRRRPPVRITRKYSHPITEDAARDSAAVMLYGDFKSSDRKATPLWLRSRTRTGRERFEPIASPYSTSRPDASGKMIATRCAETAIDSRQMQR